MRVKVAEPTAFTLHKIYCKREAIKRRKSDKRFIYSKRDDGFFIERC